MLQGSLDNFTLDEVLGLLAGTEKTGRLRVSGDRGTGSVWLDDGELIGGSISTADAEDAEDVVFEMMRFSSGNFSFIMDEHPPNPRTPAGVDTVVASAGRRLSEWREIEAVVPTLAHRVDLNPMPESAEVAMSRNEWQAVIAVGIGSSVGAVCSSLELGEVDGSRMLKGMVERGLILVDVPDVLAAPPADSGAVLDDAPRHAEEIASREPAGEMAGLGSSFLSDEAPDQGSFVDSLAAHAEPVPSGAVQPEAASTEAVTSFEATSFDAAASFEATSFEATSFEGASVEGVAVEESSFEATSFEAPSFEAAPVEAPSFEATSFEATSFEAPTFGSVPAEPISPTAPALFAEPASFDAAPAAPAPVAATRKGGLSFEQPVPEEPLDLAQLYAFSGEEPIAPGVSDDLPRPATQTPPPPAPAPLPVDEAPLAAPRDAMPPASVPSPPVNTEPGGTEREFQSAPPPSPTFDFGGPSEAGASVPAPPPPPPPNVVASFPSAEAPNPPEGFVPAQQPDVPVASPDLAGFVDGDDQEEASMLMRYLKSEH